MLTKLLMTVTMLLQAMGAPGVTDSVAAGSHYLHVDEAGYLTMWVESNHQSGLQTEPVVVMGKVTVWPDTRLHV